MKKLVALIATSILASLLLVIPTSPASADTGVCAGEGFANLTNRLYYPILGPKRWSAFFYAGGACATETGGKQLRAEGAINGWCGLSSGMGYAFGVDDMRFWFIGIGGVLIVGGHITGVAAVVPFQPATPLTPGTSCLPTGPGASTFLVTGAFVKNHIVPQTKPTPGKFPPDGLPVLCPNPPPCP